MTGYKHLIECHCVLPQFRDRSDAVYHRFVVFSELDSRGNVVPKHVQCNNCGVIHRVLDIGKSEIATGKDSSSAIISIADVKLSLPSNVIQILESYNVDLATWEEAVHIIENKLWDSFIVLTSSIRDDTIEGKCLRFNGQNSLKIEQFAENVYFPQR